MERIQYYKGLGTVLQKKRNYFRELSLNYKWSNVNCDDSKFGF